MLNRLRALERTTSRLQCGMGLVLAAVPLCLMPATPAHAAPSDLACEYEDSTACVWDARHMGNGEGRSFFRTPNGRTIFVRHWFAHRLLSKKPVECAAPDDTGCVIDGEAYDLEDYNYVITPRGRAVHVSHRFAHALIHKGF